VNKEEERRSEARREILENHNIILRTTQCGWFGDGGGEDERKD